jgi:hypothetical protein
MRHGRSSEPPSFHFNRNDFGPLEIGLCNRQEKLNEFVVRVVVVEFRKSVVRMKR